MRKFSLGLCRRHRRLLWWCKIRRYRSFHDRTTQPHRLLLKQRLHTEWLREVSIDQAGSQPDGRNGKKRVSNELMSDCAWSSSSSLLMMCRLVLLPIYLLRLLSLRNWMAANSRSDRWRWRCTTRRRQRKSVVGQTNATLEDHCIGLPIWSTQNEDRRLRETN